MLPQTSLCESIGVPDPYWQSIPMLLSTMILLVIKGEDALMTIPDSEVAPIITLFIIPGDEDEKILIPDDPSIIKLLTTVPSEAYSKSI